MTVSESPANKKYYFGSTKEPRTLSSIEILLVEDNAVNQKVADLRLMEEVHNMKWENSGKKVHQVYREFVDK